MDRFVICSFWRARELGLSPSAISRELIQSLDGVTAGIFRGAGDEKTPIRVRYAREYRDSREDAEAVLAFSERAGTTVPLRAVAEGRETVVQGLITRENLEPTLDILALHGDRPLSFVTRDVERAIGGIEVPAGYTVTLAGEERDMAEARGELIGALAVAVIGGMTAATFLTLIVIPVFYSAMDDVVAFIARLRPGRETAHSSESPP